jgi:hypothetical protein
MHLLRAVALLLFLTQLLPAGQPTPILPDPKLAPGDTFDVTAEEASKPDSTPFPTSISIRTSTPTLTSLGPRRVEFSVDKPAVDLPMMRITKVAINSYATIIYFRFENTSNYIRQVRFYPPGDSRALRIVTGDNKFNLVRVTVSPYGSTDKSGVQLNTVKSGEVLIVTATFERIPDDIISFYVSDGDTGPGRRTLGLQRY